jgi:hypothetical protein
MPFVRIRCRLHVQSPEVDSTRLNGIVTFQVVYTLRHVLVDPQARTLEQAIEIAARKAFVILDGTLLRIDRIGRASGQDRRFYSGKHKCHGVDVQVLSDPAGRLMWASPALPDARHDMGAAL